MQKPYTLSRQGISTLLKRAVWCSIVLWLVWCVWFAVYYYTTGYDTLKSWFLSLSGCIYRQYAWPSEFFTPATKKAGDNFALVAGITAALSILYLFKIRKRFEQPEPGAKTKKRLLSLWLLPVVGIGFALWYWGNGLVAAANDEIFSAVNCAEAHPFQTIAYYMLPNNHMYFNLLNGTIFRPAADHVASGRVLSMLGYCAMLCVAYTWLYGVCHNRLMALLLIMPIALQFTVWGFSFQARGYELQLLCCWIAFITVFKYAQNGGTRLLRINTFCCIAGFILVPTFLYYYLTQLAFFVCVQFINRRLDWAFWRYQAFWLVAVFLCYTPGFCFSGYSAFTGNLYVKEAFPNVGAFWPVFTDVTTYFFNFCYSCIISEGHPVNYVAVALPLLLFFLPEKNHKLLGLFYVLLWMVYAIVVLYMKRVPFNRNMILHYSLTMAASLYTFYVLIALIGRKLRANPAKMGLWAVCFVAPALLFSYHLFREDRKNVSLNLYFYDLNTLHDSMMRHISSLPPGSTVGCSDEGFYWYYYGKKNKYKTTSCPTGNEGYYVKRANEPLPPTFENKYVFEKKAYDNYEVYKKK